VEKKREMNHGREARGWSVRKRSKDAAKGRNEIKAFNCACPAAEANL